MARLRITGANFAKLTRAALEAEFGGEGDVFLGGIAEGTLEDPEKFAAELYKVYGTNALQYYVMITKYADSGLFHPGEDAEEEAEEEDLEEIVRETETDSDQGVGGDQ